MSPTTKNGPFDEPPLPPHRWAGYGGGLMTHRQAPCPNEPERQILVDHEDRCEAESCPMPWYCDCEFGLQAEIRAMAAERKPIQDDGGEG